MGQEARRRRRRRRRREERVNVKKEGLGKEGVETWELCRRGGDGPPWDWAKTLRSS